MTARYLAPRLVEPSDEVQGFRCRSAEQTDWLRHHGRQAQATGTASVHVVTESESDVVVAYYGWSMASLHPTDAPERWAKGGGRYPQPVALLVRLGVDERHEGRGLGAALLGDVLVRTLRLTTEIGCRGLIVHAEDADAAAFYRHLVPEFEPSPTDELHLVLLGKDLRRTLVED